MYAFPQTLFVTHSSNFNKNAGTWIVEPKLSVKPAIVACAMKIAHGEQFRFRFVDMVFSHVCMTYILKIANSMQSMSVLTEFICKTDV